MRSREIPTPDVAAAGVASSVSRTPLIDQELQRRDGSVKLTQLPKLMYRAWQDATPRQRRTVGLVVLAVAALKFATGCDDGLSGIETAPNETVPTGGTPPTNPGDLYKPPADCQVIYDRAVEVTATTGEPASLPATAVEKLLDCSGTGHWLQTPVSPEGDITYYNADGTVDYVIEEGTEVMVGDRPPH